MWRMDQEKGDRLLEPQAHALMLEQALLAFRHGDLVKAELLLQELWQQQPTAEVAALMAQVLRAARAWPEAIGWFEKALQADPSDFRPRLAIGHLHRLLGQSQAATACFESVLLQTTLAMAMGGEQPLLLLELGKTYVELDQPADAIAAFEAALCKDPTLVEAREALSALLVREGRISEASHHEASLVALQPDSSSPRLNLALQCFRGGDVDGCLLRLEALLAEAPDDLSICQSYLFVSSTAGERWLQRRQQVAESCWSGRVANAAGPVPRRLPAQPRAPRRIALLTAELGTHPVSCFLESFLRHHDRARFEVEVLETQPRVESRNQELREMAQASILLPEASLSVRRELIRERRYAVILETSGYTAASGLPLLAERLAPVQCHYVGFHASTFLPTIDWFIADEVLLPPQLESQFSERIWRLPRPWAAYTPPQDLPPLSSLPDGRAPVFGSCNQISKISPNTLRYWTAALRAVPHAKLLVKHRNTADPLVRQRISADLAAGGVASERVHFEGWAPDWSTHMETYNRIDVSLDATPWSSATTAFETLAMGTPLVGIRGATLAGRMSSAALAGFGEPGWVADTPEAFASIAAGLVADLPALRSERAARRQRALGGALFDGAALAMTLGDALEGMISHCGS